MGNTDYMRDDIPLLDFLIHNPTKLVIDGVSHAIEVDASGPANYVNGNTSLDRHFAKFEVPHQDALIVARF
jgi:hypothetical protein